MLKLHLNTQKKEVNIKPKSIRVKKTIPKSIQVKKAIAISLFVTIITIISASSRLPLDVYDDRSPSLGLVKNVKGNTPARLENSRISSPWLLLDNSAQVQQQVLQKSLKEANQLASPMPNEEDWLLSLPLYSHEVHYQKHGQLIPKTIHKVIITNEGSFPEYFTNIFLNMTRNITMKTMEVGSLEYGHLSWKEKNPGYKLRYFNLHHCRSYLHQFFHPMFLRAFDCIEAFAGKTDFFRFLIVYREGGFYSDWKQVVHKNRLLDWLSSDNTTWFSAWDNGFPKKLNAMQNSFFGATPQSPILAETILTILHNIRKRADLDPETSAYDMTGPFIFGKAFMKVTNDRSGIRLGNYQAHWGMRYVYLNEVIIVHKCLKCNVSQNWTEGNNYIKKHAIGEFFCPDAPSLFIR